MKFLCAKVTHSFSLILLEDLATSLNLSLCLVRTSLIYLESDSLNLNDKLKVKNLVLQQQFMSTLKAWLYQSYFQHQFFEFRRIAGQFYLFPLHSK